MTSSRRCAANFAGQCPLEHPVPCTHGSCGPRMIPAVLLERLNALQDAEALQSEAVNKSWWPDHSWATVYFGACCLMWKETGEQRCESKSNVNRVTITALNMSTESPSLQSHLQASRASAAGFYNPWIRAHGRTANHSLTCAVVHVELGASVAYMLSSSLQLCGSPTKKWKLDCSCVFMQVRVQAGVFHGEPPDGQEQCQVHAQGAHVPQ
jgi:hypothetical protein